MKFKQIIGFLTTSAILAAAPSAHALVGRNCEGENLKISAVELFNSDTALAIGRWDIAAKKLTFKDSTGKTVSVPSNCTVDRKFVVPAALATQVKGGNFNMRYTIEAKPGSYANARRFYGKDLIDMAVKFAIAQPGTTTYGFNQTEYANPRDMCGTVLNNKLIACRDAAKLKAEKITYPLQIRTCGTKFAGIGKNADIISCRGGDILFQGELQFE